MRRNSFLAFFLLISLVTCGLFAAPAPVSGSPLAQGSGIALIAPSACPPGGCAAGQRLTYQLDFELGVYNAALTVPNVKVCVYIPTNWFDSASVILDPNGGITGNPYNNVVGTTNCPEDTAPPTNYTLAAAGESLFQNVFVFHDSLDLSFRLVATASSAGSVLMRVYERTANTASLADWTRTAQVFTAQLTPVAPGTTLYVADNASACTSNPCYLNSGGDFAGGIGTGLKDAVDVAPAGAQIIVLGSVGLKGNTVRVNKSVTLKGSGDATLTASGGGCTNPLLEISAGGTLSGLEYQGRLMCFPGPHPAGDQFERRLPDRIQ